MDVGELVDNYFDRIEIEDCDYVPVDDATHDAAYLLLSLPMEMLREYCRLRDIGGDLPDGAEFWRESGLLERLRNSDKYHGQGREPLPDILDFLGGDVWGTFQGPSSREQIRLDVTEVPEFYKD